TPQLPACSQGGASSGLEIALAITPPISKKLPPVAAVPILKYRVSSARAAAASRPAKSKLAQRRLRQQCQTLLVSPRETAMGDDTMLDRQLQPGGSTALVEQAAQKGG